MKSKVFIYIIQIAFCCAVMLWGGYIYLANSGWMVSLLGAVAIIVSVGLIIRSFAQIIKIFNKIGSGSGQLGDKLGYINQGDYNIYLDPGENPYDKIVADTVNHLTAKVLHTTKSLTTEQRKTEYILDNMDSGMLVLDSEMTVRQCNSSVYKYLACGDDLPGKNLSDIPEGAPFMNGVKHALKNQMSSVFDLDLMDKTGIIASVRINPVSAEWVGDENGIAAVIIITNVTQSRQIERLRSEFVANVSHELKTPITSISGFAELIESGVVTNESTVQEYVGRIHEEAQRMTYLIDDILRLSSLESKQAEEIYESVDLRVLCEDIFVSLSPIMRARGITGEVIGAAAYNAYPDDMYQLMKNLIENAVKYNRDNGKVTVRISPDAYSRTITVSDTGIGIPLEHQSRIFERFYRVDKGRSKRVGGTGLGLSIVKHIAAKYHGQVSLSSKTDEGTSIKITLPINKVK